MLAKRIIPCLDVTGGRVVKGINFEGLRDAGSILEQARFYNNELADELVFLDISASLESRKTTLEEVMKVSGEVFIPLTVGGGINSVERAKDVFLHGADKVSVNTAAVNHPELISRIAEKYGSQAVVVAIDIKKIGSDHMVHTHSGKNPTAYEALEWAHKVQELGAGEILLTSMDRDGTREGYDNDILARVSTSVHIPVIASGGAGNLEHLYEGFTIGHADAALAASIFHFRQYSIRQAKQYLRDRGIEVRL
ncbi:imidazole glycerol phosphate synthase subunit HisF [Chlorobium phaeobacteroides]|uniref:Imidazole glycerol phosphate synthase subunit HisF n=1 Tax=Chlorobium phaeobacteroides (strain DSM 266 / SMG 266 / 2430) TaxID=290317 RepID=HIS6_CHLPD|nr:imidazole glycerol phosphate synthase subunit HisF [Chlorobium phaeobacteroides]A1BHP6.1 RecName: Full=Imidazole glycerol phosphate synthase subunit HisF; AltName: Full=IGP synthase cyclase subunit; AltName: Full=IGP synthase subunit HisF; AltName: Full=ImGP synthase subunit HisF; Short=IGPS subunit HisF [Chlorobium phaeobacteroides DSM 266]ABL65923.1 imidazole glycerol phosphate synthase subunit hisF [Chlorobium phaeobacteroides DSM 266]